MYQSLAMMFIIMESWAAAHKEIHAPPITHRFTIRSGEPYPPPPPPSLIQCILGNVGFPTPLLPPPLLQHTFGLSFPDLTTPPPSMPESFSLTPLEWKYPSMPYIEPTANAATVDANAPPDWVRQIQIRTALQQIGSALQSTAMSWNAAPITPDVPPDENTRRVKRAIKPLPKRAQVAYGIGNTISAGGRCVGSVTVVAALTQAAFGVGSAIATGVKRLRDELEEGGLRRWKKLRMN
jgi:hypothetical protein